MMKQFISAICVVILSVVNAYSQEFSNTVLKNVMWIHRDSRAYMFSDSHVYMRGLIESANWGTSVVRCDYYLSTKPVKAFEYGKVGKNSTGKYLVWNMDRSPLRENFDCLEIVSCDGNILKLYEGPNFKDYRDTLVFYREHSESFDTLRLDYAYRELEGRRTLDRERNYLESFPSTWYDFERTFHKAFFPALTFDNSHTDLSLKADKYLKAFQSLKLIPRYEYCSKIIDITTGMTISENNSSQKWRNIVVDALTNEDDEMLNALHKKNSLEQSRFWEFVLFSQAEDLRKLIDNVCRIISIKDSVTWRQMERYRKAFSNSTLGSRKCPQDRVIKGVWQKTKAKGILKVARVYTADSLYILFDNLSDTPHMTIRHDIADTILLKTDGFKAMPMSLDTDTMTLAASCRELNLANGHNDILMQELFFESFPSTWGDFHAMMESAEVGNRNFRSNAIGYLERFSELNAIPMADYIRKIVSVSIGALSNSTVSEHWRQIVKRITETHKAETGKVLEEYAPWQRLSFLEFVENKGVQM